MYRKIYLAGIIAYVILFIFAVLFYEERIIFLDTANNIFCIIARNGYFIGMYRFGDVITQSIPLLASRAGLPLNTVLLGYSLGFSGLFFACYFICGNVLKQYDFALIILLLNVLFATHTFYYIASPLPQGIAVFITVLAYSGNKPFSRLKPVQSCITLAALITVAFYHPLIIVVLLFSLIFMFRRQEIFVDKRLLYAIAAAYFTAILLKATVFRSQYEQHSLSGLKNFMLLFPDYLHLFSNRQFLHQCLTQYYWLPVLFVIICFCYISQKRTFQLFFFAGSFLGFLILVNICYPFPATPVFYIENLYLPLNIFIALPFVFDVLPVLDKKKLAIPFFTLIIITGIIRIYTAHNTYTARLDYERKYLDEYGEQKVIVKAAKKDKQVLQMLWGTPYEFLLLSELERNKPASIIIDDDPEQRGWAMYQHKALVVNWDIIPYTQLNPHYFCFTDTTTGYTIMK